MTSELLPEPSSSSSPTTPNLQTARAPRGESAECCPQTQMRRREWEREVTERRHLDRKKPLLDRRRRDLESAIDATVPKTMMGPDAPTRAACDREYTQEVVPLEEAVLLNILAPEHRGLSSGKTHRKGDTAWSKGKFARQVKIEPRADGWDKERRDGCGNKSKAGINKTCGDDCLLRFKAYLGTCFQTLRVAGDARNT